MTHAENKKKKRRKVVTGTLAICLLAALGIGGTLAYLTDTEQVTNRFSTGDLDIDIDESDWDDEWDDDDDDDDDDDGRDDNDDGGDGKNLVPGDVRHKNPTVTAYDGDSYMRVVMQIRDDNGEPIDGVADEDFIYSTVFTDLDALVAAGNKAYTSATDLEELLAVLKKLRTEPNFIGATAQTDNQKIDAMIAAVKAELAKETINYTLTQADITALKAEEKTQAVKVEPLRLKAILETIYYDTAYVPGMAEDSEDRNISEQENYYIGEYGGDTGKTAPVGAKAIPTTGVNKPGTYDGDGETETWASVVDKTVAGTNTDAFELDEKRSKAGVYFYNYIIDETDDNPLNMFKQGTKATLFTDIIIPADYNQDQIAILGKYEIVLQAQAIQYSNFPDAATAYEALDVEIVNGTAQKNYDELGEQYDEKDQVDLAHGVVTATT